MLRNLLLDRVLRACIAPQGRTLGTPSSPDGFVRLADPTMDGEKGAWAFWTGRMLRNLLLDRVLRACIAPQGRTLGTPSSPDGFVRLADPTMDGEKGAWAFWTGRMLRNLLLDRVLRACIAPQGRTLGTPSSPDGFVRLADPTMDGEKGAWAFWTGRMLRNLLLDRVLRACIAPQGRTLGTPSSPDGFVRLADPTMDGEKGAWAFWTGRMLRNLLLDRVLRACIAPQGRTLGTPSSPDGFVRLADPTMDGEKGAWAFWTGRMLRNLLLDRVLRACIAPQGRTLGTPSSPDGFVRLADPTMDGEKGAWAFWTGRMLRNLLLDRVLRACIAPQGRTLGTPSSPDGFVRLADPTMDGEKGAWAFWTGRMLRNLLLDRVLRACIAPQGRTLGTPSSPDGFVRLADPTMDGEKGAWAFWTGRMLRNLLLDRVLRACIAPQGRTLGTPSSPDGFVRLADPTMDGEKGAWAFWTGRMLRNLLLDRVLRACIAPQGRTLGTPSSPDGFVRLADPTMDGEKGAWAFWTGRMLRNLLLDRVLRACIAPQGRTLGTPSSPDGFVRLADPTMDGEKGAWAFWTGRMLRNLLLDRVLRACIAPQGRTLGTPSSPDGFVRLADPTMDGEKGAWAFWTGRMLRNLLLDRVLRACIAPQGRTLGTPSSPDGFVRLRDPTMDGEKGACAFWTGRMLRNLLLDRVLRACIAPQGRTLGTPSSPDGFVRL